MAAVKTDYYELLGVPRDADAETIRRAFHALARETHPDVSASPDAERRFRELAEAYSVLSKPESRMLYDRYGYRGRGNAGFEEALWEARPRVERAANVELGIELRGFEALEGARPVVRYDAAVPCEACAGLGVLGEPDPDCAHCEGTGRQRRTSEVEAAHLLRLEPCPECAAEACPECNGTGLVRVERRLRVRVPPGVEDGTLLRVAGEGDAGGRGVLPGDLLVDVRVLPEPRDWRLVRYVALALLVAAIAILIMYLR